MIVIFIYYTAKFWILNGFQFDSIIIELIIQYLKHFLFLTTVTYLRGVCVTIEIECTLVQISAVSNNLISASAKLVILTVKNRNCSRWKLTKRFLCPLFCCA